jgi:hypothetical protein
VPLTPGSRIGVYGATDEPFVAVLNWFQELRAHLGK